MRPPPAPLALLWLALLLACSAPNQAAAAWGPRRLLAPSTGRHLLADYSNLLRAAQSEVRVINQLYNGVFTEKGWARTPDFQPLLGVAINPRTNMTAFFPSDESWRRVADYYCLTQQAVLDNISNLPSMLAGYIKLHLVPNMTLFSDDFRNGMRLPTLKTENGQVTVHTLSQRKINGTLMWVFKDASIFYDPATRTFEDVIVNASRMDITAGNGVIHVVNTMFRDGETERFWMGLRSQVLARAGMSPDSQSCPSVGNAAASSPAMSNATVAGIVIGSVLGVLGLCLAVMLLMYRRPHKGSLKPLDSLRRMSWQRSGKPGGGAIGSGGGGDPARGGGGTPLLYHPSSNGRAGPLSAPLMATGSGSLSSSSLSVVSMQQQGAGGSDQQQQLTAEHMSAVAEEGSPFMRLPPSRGSHPHLAAAAAAGAAGVAGVAAGALLTRQHTGSAPDTPSSSNGAPRSKVLESCGSGTPSMSGCSTRDHTGALHAGDAVAAAGVTANGLQQNGLDHDVSSSSAAGQHCLDSLSGMLGPTDSVPVGRINQEHVIPLSELQLRELIGSGAEGKVYRGTWKHTDIAAKEYLPIEPPDSSNHTNGSSSKPGDGPSEAAMASARAALAKEVHWLTSLNHPNLVRFCAVCLERPLVVMEFYKHGSVFAMLQKASRQLAALELSGRQLDPAQPPPALSPKKTKYISYFNWDRRLEMLHDVAAGMSYLHGKDHIHGDLRSPNLFVGADGKVKIGDFGFTKRLTNRASLKVKRITHPRWVAPELMMDNILSRASDVYSFGIIMYELLTFQIPFDPLGKEQVVINVMQGFRPVIPGEDDLPPGTSSSTCLATYVRLMCECWAQDSVQRPSFEVIARRLKAMQRWRMLISRHSTLQRAVSAIKHSHSSSSLSNSQISRLTASDTPHRQRSGALGKSVSTEDMGAGTPSMSRNGGGWQRSLAGHPMLQRGGMESTGALVSASVPFDDLGLCSEVDDDDGDELPHQDDLEDADAMLAASSIPSSIPVSKAIVRGTRLAVIGVSTPQEERNALASTCPELAAAKQVLLVTSDLPTGRPFSRQALKERSSSSGGGALPEVSLRRSSLSYPPRAAHSAGVQAEALVPRANSDLTAVHHHHHRLQLQLQQHHKEQQQQLQQQQAQEQQQLLRPLAATTTTATAMSTAAATMLAAAAAGAARMGGFIGVHPSPLQQQQQPHLQLPQLQGHGSAPQAQPGHQQVVVLQGAAAAAAVAAAASTVRQQGSAQSGEVPRRHSEPLPSLRWSQEMLVQQGGGGGTTTTSAAADANGLLPGAEHDTMSSGMSPFAVVHVAPPGYDGSDAELQQQLQLGGQLVLGPQHGGAHGGVSQPLHGPAGAGAAAAYEAWQLTGKQQHPMQQQQWKSRSVPDQMHAAQQVVLVQHPVIIRGAQEQQQQQGLQQELAAAQELPPPAAAAAAVAQPGEGEGWCEGEMYTTFDSPFYLGGLWAPSPSASDLDQLSAPLSAPDALSPSGSGARPGSAVASPGSSLTVAQITAAHAAAAAAIVAAVGHEEAAAAAAAPPVQQQLQTRPSLNQALTIQYNADMTPLAAAAAAAVSLHPPSRRNSGGASQPSSRHGSFSRARAGSAAAAAPAGASSSSNGNSSVHANGLVVVPSSNGSQPSPSRADSTATDASTVAAASDADAAAAGKPPLSPGVAVGGSRGKPQVPGSSDGGGSSSHDASSSPPPPAAPAAVDKDVADAPARDSKPSGSAFMRALKRSLDALS